MPRTNNSRSSARSVGAKIAKQKLGKLTVAKLKAAAKEAGVKGYSTMNKTQLVDAVYAQAGAVRHPKAIYRVVIVKGDAIYGDLGPYATARAALADAKNLLRRMAPIEDYAISNADAQVAVGSKLAGGSIVDGYVTRSKGSGKLDAGAYAVGFDPSKKRSAAIGEASDLLPGKLLRQNRGRRNRSNPRVSFKTKSGESVSFMAKNSPKRRPRSNGYGYRDEFDAIREYTQMQYEADAIAKDRRASYAEKRRMLRSAYDRAIARHPSKAAGRRNLGGVSEWYDAAGLLSR